MLNRQDFKFVVEKLGFVPTVDLFASLINTQLQMFMPYRPDPNCIAADSFTQSWTGLEFYAFPTFICIHRVMQKIWKDRAVGVLVTPDWPNQIWYSQLSQLIIKEVVLPPTITHKIFETNSVFQVKQRTTGKVSFLFFKSFLLVSTKL